MAEGKDTHSSEMAGRDSSTSDIRPSPGATTPQTTSTEFSASQLEKGMDGGSARDYLVDIQSRTSEPEHDPSSFTKLFRRCLRHVFTHPLPTSDPGPPPDGGLLAWSQVLAGHLICSVTWGNVTSFGVFQTYYVETLGRTASDVSWIGGIQIFLLLAIGTFSGRATDAGLAHWVVLLGSTVLVFGTLMTSFATEYWQIFLSQGVCVGLGMGIVYMPGLAMISTYFSKKKSLASSIFASGAGTGGLIFPAIVQQLLPRVGFGWTVRCVALVTLIICIIFSLLLRQRLPPRKAGPLVDWPAFREPPYVLFIVGFFLIYWAIYFAFYYIDSYGRDFGYFSGTDSTNLLLISNGIGIPGRIVVGYAADRWFGPVNTAIPMAAIVSILLFCWIPVHSHAGLYTFAVTYGFFAAAVQGLFAGSLASLSKDLSKTGTRMGMVFTVMSFACLTGPPVAGAIIGHDHGSYLGAQIWAGIAVFAGCAALMAARICQTGWVLRARM